MALYPINLSPNQIEKAIEDVQQRLSINNSVIEAFVIAKNNKMVESHKAYRERLINELRHYYNLLRGNFIQQTVFLTPPFK